VHVSQTKSITVKEKK